MRHPAGGVATHEGVAGEGRAFLAAVALVVHPVPGQGFDLPTQLDVEVGVLVPTHGVEEERAFGARGPGREAVGGPFDGQFVAAVEKGQGVVLVRDQFPDRPVTRAPAARGDGPRGVLINALVHRREREGPVQVGVFAEAAPVQVGAVGRQPHEARIAGKPALEQGDAVPVNLEGGGQAQAVTAGRQLAGQVNEDGLGLPGGGAGHDVHRLPAVRGGFDLELREREGQVGVVRSGHVGHAAAETQPAGERQHQGPVHRQRAEVQHHAMRLGQAAQLRDAQPVRGDAPVVGGLEQVGAIAAVQACGGAQRHAVFQRPQLPGRKRRAGAELVGGVHLRAGGVVHHDQFGFIEVQHLAQFLGDLHHVASVARAEAGLVAQPDVLAGVGGGKHGVGHAQAQRRRAEQVGDETEPLAVPGVQVGAGAGGQDRLGHFQRALRVHLHVHDVEGQVEPAGGE